MLIHNSRGNFRFIKGIGPFSFGATADSGYEVVHAAFKPLPKLSQGLDFIPEYLKRVGRPLNGLCGVELRIPAPLSTEGFARFNAPYQEKLASWNLSVDGANPVARTNVAYVVVPVGEPSVYGFYYTAASDRHGATFVVAGAADSRLSESGQIEVVARGDVSSAGLQRKVVHVTEEVTRRIGELGATWSDVTGINVYAVHNIHPLIDTVFAPALKDAMRAGLRWYYSRPPVEDLDFELDCRSVNQELIVSV